jgi:hypothetical protein
MQKHCVFHFLHCPKHRANLLRVKELKGDLGFRFQVSGFRFQVSGVRFQVSVDRGLGTD